MRTQKRDMAQRAYRKGFQAGISSKTREACPHESISQREQWMAGWRDGRDANWSSLTGVRALQSISAQQIV